MDLFDSQSIPQDGWVPEMTRFARLYADQTEADHAALVTAADRGIVPIERGL